MKLSVITWDNGEREFFHTVDCFGQQSLLGNEFEFIWVQYYARENFELRARIDSVPNARLLTLGLCGEWHAGVCLNAGVASSQGEVLVLIDGDIVVPPNMLEQVWEVHKDSPSLAMYVRRWDEAEVHSGDRSYAHLDEVCRLTNAENFGGCLTIRRRIFDQLGGYEEHPVMSGPGAISKELAVRIRNAGIPIMWHPSLKVYHPWHPGTLPSVYTKRQEEQRTLIGIRSLRLDVQADREQVDVYIGAREGGQSKLMKSRKCGTRLKVYLVEIVRCLLGRRRQ